MIQNEMFKQSIELVFYCPYQARVSFGSKNLRQPCNLIQYSPHPASVRLVPAAVNSFGPESLLHRAAWIRSDSV
ncbi:MAG: hypothetical protein CBC35_00405 [Planctomycetes bacterium TMED75]|nr:hypothetical protein [Planctomycetaceae bacterium]OUU96912.1 MAG: hypothetical protein CBC35_00405 [Planctomycetes bacterium TMED75]